MADNFNEIINQGVSIYGSREKIRYQLTEFAKKYLELQSVDFYKTSLVSYLIDCLSILSANHIFYDSVIYKEFFMVDAQMPESVYNLAKWIGYQPPLATPARVDVMFTIPLSFQSAFATFNIPSDFKVKAGDIPYKISSISSSVPAAYFSYNRFNQSNNIDSVWGNIINNNALTVKDSNGTFRPVYVDNTGKKASFILSFIQEEKSINKFQIPKSTEPFQFYSKLITFNGMLSGMEVYVMEPPPGVNLDIGEVSTTGFDPSIPGPNGAEWKLWTQSEHGIYTMSPNTAEYVFTGGSNKGEIFFGNGIVGKQPAKGSIVVVILYVTKGSSGNIIPNSLTSHDPLYYQIANRYDEQGRPISQAVSKQYTIDFEVMNPSASIGGTDVPSLPEIKRNAIVNLRSKGKLVSDTDYDDINVIMGPSFPSSEVYPILKRSDIKVNEISPFIRLTYRDENSYPQIVPTRNVKYMVYNPTFVDGAYTVFRGTRIAVDSIWKKTVLGERVGYEVTSLTEPDTRTFAAGDATTIVPGGNTPLELGWAEFTGDLYEPLFNMTIHEDVMMAYYDYACMNIYYAPATLYDGSTIDPYLNQFSYIPITGVDFNINFDDFNQSPYDNDASSSSSSTGEETGVAKLDVVVNVNHIYSAEMTDFRCKMITKWDSNQEYDTVSESKVLNTQTPQNEEYRKFNFEIPNYLIVPTGIQRFEFLIQALTWVRDQQTHEPIVDVNSESGDYLSEWQTIAKYYVDVVIRQDLSDFMFSSVTKTNEWDGTTHDYYRYEIHNTPTVLSNYLDGSNNSGVLNRVDNVSFNNFEMVVLQKLVNTLYMADKRMLTDSINIKFCDTYGQMNNLKYNDPDYIVRSRFNTPFDTRVPPTVIMNSDYDPLNGYTDTVSRFIINGPAVGAEFTAYASTPLSKYLNYIAERFPGGSWHFMEPKRGEYAKVLDELDLYGREKIVVYTGSEWKDVQEYKIPLNINARVQLAKNSTVDSSKLVLNIKDALMAYFLQRMGVQKSLDRSEIITVIRDVPNVTYCDLIEPETDIKFEYELKDLTQQELIDYTPQYVGFNEQTINIEVIN